MADWSVTYGGVAVIGQTEGVFTFAPGMMPPRIQFDIPARSIGEIPKSLGVAACDHTLTVTFTAVAAGSVATINGRMLTLSHSAKVASLVVPGYGTVANCTVSSVTPGEFALRGAGVPPYATKVYDMSYTIIFRQVAL